MGVGNANLAALIGSRICHDLISPIGAINNGLELLNMSGAPTGPEMGLIGESVEHASARIRFFRVAFGAAGDQMLGPAEVQSILGHLYDGGRLCVQWAVDSPVDRAEVRLVFLALLCMESALPYGGTISVSHLRSTWILEATADRINMDAALWSHLESATAAEDILPAQVQFALLPLHAADMGRGVTYDATETKLIVNL